MPYASSIVVERCKQKIQKKQRQNIAFFHVSLVHVRNKVEKGQIIIAFK